MTSFPYLPYQDLTTISSHKSSSTVVKKISIEFLKILLRYVIQGKIWLKLAQKRRIDPSILSLFINCPYSRQGTLGLPKIAVYK